MKIGRRACSLPFPLLYPPVAAAATLSYSAPIHQRYLILRTVSEIVTMLLADLLDSGVKLGVS